MILMLATRVTLRGPSNSSVFRTASSERTHTVFAALQPRWPYGRYRCRPGPSPATPATAAGSFPGLLHLLHTRYACRCCHACALYWKKASRCVQMSWSTVGPSTNTKI
eukprot:91592-Chlamydomonas_euryale.AAC.3